MPRENIFIHHVITLILIRMTSYRLSPLFLRQAALLFSSASPVEVVMNWYTTLKQSLAHIPILWKARDWTSFSLREPPLGD